MSIQVFDPYKVQVKTLPSLGLEISQKLILGRILEHCDYVAGVSGLAETAQIK